jgi:NAD(P)-dependent dehydrogenase (short-subunit alcohol dehydrogenase family)
MESSPRFAGRRLLVVGGGSGIGWSAAVQALGEGARVVVADIDPATAARTDALGGRISFVRIDATDGASVDRAFTVARDRLGGLDAVLATVGGAVLADVPDLDRQIWDRELDVNLTSAWLVARAALAVLTEQGDGALCLTSSGQAVMSATDRAAYAAAKAGVISLTRSLASYAAAHRVRVNCIAPGPTDTPRFRAMNGGDAGVEKVRAAMPLGAIPTPEECAEVALFLLSPAASAVTGQTVHVNGGLLMP